MADNKRTMFAGQAFSLAELFKISFGATKVQGPVPYGAELSAPEGDSTGGGKQALQHVSLIPEGGGASIVVATANGVEKRIELRTHANVSEAHRRRFKGAPFPIDKAQYEQFLGKVSTFFDGREFKVTRVDAPAAAPARPVAAAPAASASVADEESAAPSTSKGKIIALVGVVVLVLAVAILALR